MNRDVTRVCNLPYSNPPGLRMALDALVPFWTIKVSSEYKEWVTILIPATTGPGVCRMSVLQAQMPNFMRSIYTAAVTCCAYSC